MNLDPHETSLVIKIADLVAARSETLAPKERADLFHGLSLCLKDTLPSLSKTALETATAIREAEGQQLLFRQLLKSGGGQ